MKHKGLIIYGPTSTGKTGLALQLARKFKGEIISVDSRQVYKNLDIGTGKVSFESKVEKHSGYWQVDGVKIHGFDIIEPGKNFSASDFIKFAQSTIEQILRRKKLPIIVGGTGFYLKSLLQGIESSGIPQNLKLRSELELQTKKELLKKLQKLDPIRAKSMNESDRQNPRRLIRAIEIAISKSEPISRSASSWSLVYPESYRRETGNFLLLGLTAPNAYIYKKSDKWLETRMNHGLVDEIRGLLKKRVDNNWLENLGLEYRWITRYLKGEINKKSAVERLKGDIHDFIRRQKTYFNKFKSIQMFDVSQKNWQKELEKTVTLWYTRTK